MANRIRGEIEAELDGNKYTLCLTLGALAELEDSLASGSLTSLSERFAAGDLSATDLQKIIFAGLVGGGNSFSLEEVGAMRVEGGITAYADIAARLLTATFTPIEEQE